MTMNKGALTQVNPQLCVMRATLEDGPYLIAAFEQALAPYYDGDHVMHARRVLQTHLSGGTDHRGLLSARQLLLVLWVGSERRGILNLVFKRQSTCKISPLILFPPVQQRKGMGTTLIRAAEEEARNAGARNLYCTVTSSNRTALEFFLELGFVICGNAHEQYKTGETETLLRKSLAPPSSLLGAEDIISVIQVQDAAAWREVRKLLASNLHKQIEGVNDSWLESMHRNATNCDTSPKDEGRRVWIYAAQDRSGRYRAAAIVTYKKGGALKVMPIAAHDVTAFRALIVDLPTLLFGCGRKMYIHHAPTAAEVAALQESPWEYEGQFPETYRKGVTTQQWGCPLDGGESIRSLRINDRYLYEIKSGHKKLEIRVAYEHIKKIKTGDLIRLVSTSTSDQVVRRVRDVRRYASLDQMLQHEDIEQVLPGHKSDDALQRLREIYPPKKEQLGIVVLDLS
jgi:ASC-1-like (ASCH) protein/GNAT superfamily N-acetyltransferase